jgi:Holliday junction resolvase RusA-like endonuclease
LEITITLPYPPSVNNYKRIGKLLTTSTGKIYQCRVNSDETKRYYYEVWMKIRAYAASERLETPLDSTISLSLEVDMHPPDKRLRDVDGIAKVLLDSLQRGGLIENDYQIARLLIERKDIISQGKIIVRIKPL